MKKLKNETGRSMVEMLGVLAIIGVLSVGGIAGYTSAMRQYRANEIVNATSMLYMMGASQNQGAGDKQMLYSAALGTVPSGVSEITYNADKTITLAFTDTDVCPLVKNKLGDKATDDCANNTITVNFGETTLVTEAPEPTHGAPCNEPPDEYRCNFSQQTLFQCNEGEWMGIDFCGECSKGSSKCSSGKIIKCNGLGYWGEPETDTEGKCVIEGSSCTTGNYKCEGASALYKCVNGAWERYCSCMDGCDHPDEEASNISDVCMTADIYCG